MAKPKSATRTLTPFIVTPLALHELIVMPQFGDFIDTSGTPQPSDEEGDWTIMDNVVYRRPVFDVFGGQNVLKRRDATCKIIYTPVARMGARYIMTEPLYAAIEDCEPEFYQGAFQDFRNEDRQAIWDNVMPILDKGFATDIYTNKWFGDVTRFPDSTGVWSWNKFDGVFTWIARYITDGTIPADQTFTIPSGTLSPTQANTALSTAYAAQDGMMENYDDDLKAFYVDKKLANAYHDYLIQSGVTTFQQRMDGSPMLFFKGIEIKIKKWDGILKTLNGGTQAHAVILTLQGNFLFATDKDYGGGPDMDEAVVIWYSFDDGVWRKQIHVKGGTQIIAPQFMVFGMTEF